MFKNYDPLFDLIDSLIDETNLYRRGLLNDYKQLSRLYKNNEDPQLKYKLEEVIENIEAINELWEILNKFKIKCLLKYDDTETETILDLLEEDI
jgi:hypothetical protein